MQRSKNPFEVLGREMEEGDISKERTVPEQQEGLAKAPEEEEVQQMDVTVEEEGNELELGKLDLDAIEEECGKKGQGYVSRH